LEVPIEIIDNLDRDETLANQAMIQKIKTLNSFEDRLLFASLIDAREVLYADLRKMIDKNNYLFTQQIRMSYLDRYREDPAFKTILRAANLLKE